MRPLRYSANVTLDGCCAHDAVPPHTDFEALHRHAAQNLDRADALLLGRVTYQMMESAFRDPGDDDVFARTIDALPKHVVSSTLDDVDWNATLLRGDLEAAVRALKRQPGRGISVGGVTLPLALAELGLIDEYELVVHPRVAGHGPTLFAGLSRPLDLVLTQRLELGAGVTALRHEPRRRPGEVLPDGQ